MCIMKGEVSDSRGCSAGAPMRDRERTQAGEMDISSEMQLDVAGRKLKVTTAWG